MTVVFEIVDGPDAGRQFAYAANTSFMVGRGVQHDSGLLVPADNYMSRHHFLVSIGLHDCEVRDCGSSNGLFVNEHRVTSAALKSGDRIRAGRTTLQVVSDGARPAPQPERVDAAVEERFELGPQIASGGTARVLRARDRVTGEAVALKVLSVEFTDVGKALPIFQRELDAALQLQHENIVPVVAVGCTEKQAWLASRWIDGPTLGERVDRGPLLTQRQALQLASHLCSAVGHAHSKGFVHRDIKPGNVMLEKASWGYRPLLMDFGLAKKLESNATLTDTGVVRGTPLFMPPEQVADSRSAGPQADQFALAACLYYALTGKWHYRQGSGTVWEAIMEGTVIPLRARRRRLHGTLERVLLQALARRPDQRFASIEAFRAQVEQLLVRTTEDEPEHL